MSTDQPAPPSIPPRKRPDGAPDPRASTALPHVVAAGSPPVAPAPVAPAPRGAAPLAPGPLSPAARAAAAMGSASGSSTGGREPAPEAVPVTSSMLKALKTASAAVAGATSAVGGYWMSLTAAA